MCMCYVFLRDGSGDTQARLTIHPAHDGHKSALAQQSAVRAGESSGGWDPVHDGIPNIEHQTQ